MSGDRQRVLIEKLTTPELSELQVCGAIRELSQFRNDQSEKAIEEQLSSDSAVVRHTALSVLVFDWGIPQHRDTALRFLLRDPDKDNRRLGAGCLGSLLRGSRDRGVLSTLLQVFLTDNEEFTVRSGAYFSILDVLGEAPGKHRVSLKPERFELQIDWDIIARLKEEFGL